MIDAYDQSELLVVVHEFLSHNMLFIDSLTVVEEKIPNLSSELQKKCIGQSKLMLEMQISMIRKLVEENSKLMDVLENICNKLP